MKEEAGESITLNFRVRHASHLESELVSSSDRQLINIQQSSTRYCLRPFLKWYLAEGLNGLDVEGLDFAITDHVSI